MSDFNSILEDWKTELFANLILGIFAIAFKNYPLGPITLGILFLIISAIVTAISVIQAYSGKEWIRLVNIITAIIVATWILSG